MLKIVIKIEPAVWLSTITNESKGKSRASKVRLVLVLFLGVEKLALDS